MPVLAVETYEDLIKGRYALIAAGFSADSPVVLNLTNQINKASGAAARTIVTKFEEIAASINAKTRRARSTKDEDKSYNVDKLVYEMKNVIITFQAVIDSFGRDVLETGGNVDARVGQSEAVPAAA